MNTPVFRRRFLKSFSLFPFLAGSISVFGEETSSSFRLKGNIRQSVCYGAYRSIPLEVFARQCKKIGLVGIDLVNPDEWATVMENGLIVTLSRAPGASQTDSFNHRRYHEKLETLYSELLPLAGKACIRQMICFSGSRKGINDEEGMENCVVGLKRILPIAEKNGVTLVMELLNSFDHKDYHADHTVWGAKVARRLGSENFKLLYDIYHMQRMEGNLIETIKKNKDVIGHYHTAGVPGRKDLDDAQEINYPAVMRAILETGFKGYVAHEFTPQKNDKMESLRDATRVCDV